MVSREEIEDAIRRSGGYRTTLGLNPDFTCDCCHRSWPNADEYAGGIWVGGHHFLICNDCSALDPHWTTDAEKWANGPTVAS